MIASHRPNLWQAWKMCPMSDETTYSSMVVLVSFGTASKQRVDHRVLPQVASKYSRYLLLIDDVSNRCSGCGTKI